MKFVLHHLEKSSSIQMCITVTIRFKSTISFLNVWRFFISGNKEEVARLSSESKRIAPHYAVNVTCVLCPDNEANFFFSLGTMQLLL